MREVSLHMNAIMFDGPTIPAIPLARMIGRFALLLAFAALYGLSPALALPLLGAAESFVIPGSSSATHAGATSSKGDPGVGTGNSNTGGAVELTRWRVDSSPVTPFALCRTLPAGLARD
jgi:hypothetical protein